MTKAYLALLRRRESRESLWCYDTELLIDLAGKNCDTIAQSLDDNDIVDIVLVKQGERSVGVARQYQGALRRIGNCQVVVSAGCLAG